MLGAQYKPVGAADDGDQWTGKVFVAATKVIMEVDVIDTILMYMVLLALVIVAGKVLFLSFVRIAGLLGCQT